MTQTFYSLSRHRLESEHAFADDALIRFGVYNNVDNFGTGGDPRTNFVRRSLLQQNAISLSTLVRFNRFFQPLLSKSLVV